MLRIPLQPETRAARAMAMTVTALMVALGIFALAGAAALRHADLGWRNQLAGRWTAELAATDLEQPVPDADIEHAIAALKATTGVVEARIVGPEEVRQLLKPWLGDSAAMTELPLPTLIDVTVDAAHPPALAVAAQALTAAVPRARLDDHAAWTHDVLHLIRTGELLGLALFGVIALTTVLTVATAARARLAVNREEIELLHTIGASDGYISRQFQADAFRSALIGAIAGVVIAAAAGAGLFAAGRSFAPLLLQLALAPRDWGILAAAPVGAVLLATYVARGTALTLVRRLP